MSRRDQPTCDQVRTARELEERISRFYLALGTVLGSLSRGDILTHLRKKGASQNEILKIQEAGASLAATAYDGK